MSVAPSTPTVQVGATAAGNAVRVLGRVRLELGDLAFPFSFQVVGDGERRHFNIEHRPVDLRTIAVVQAAVASTDATLPFQDPRVRPPTALPLSDTITTTGAFDSAFSHEFDPITLHAPQYVLDAEAGMIVFATPPLVGTIYEISGAKWRYFTDDDLMVFIGTSVEFHAKNQTNSAGGAWSLENMPAIQEYPVALYAVIQALWALVTDAAFDIDILAPDGVNIPRSERYRQLIELIGARQTQYDEIAALLNVGLSAIEVYTVRRTAKLTNRLVPVFLPQEADDWSRPRRALFDPILLGTKPVDTQVGAYDLDVYSGYPWSIVIDFNRDLTGYTPMACVRKNRGSPYGTPLLWFHTQILDRARGQILMWLTAAQTRVLPYTAYWEFQLAWDTDPTWTPTPFLAGKVRASMSEVVAP